MHGGCRAACSPLCAGPGNSADTTATACARSLSAPTVAVAVGDPAPPAARSTTMSAVVVSAVVVSAAVASRSVHTAGNSVLLPSGSTTSSSTVPWRRIRPSTVNVWPCKGCRARVTRTALAGLIAHTRHE